MHKKTWFHWISVAVAASMLLSACGGGGSESASASASAGTSTNVPGTQPSAVALKRTTPMGVLIPLYGYPLVSSGSGSTRTTVPNPAWTTVASNAALVPTIAVINPSNGPVACATPPSANLSAFQQGIAQLHLAGVTVLGYVHTSYGQRDPALVQQDVQTYAQCYGVDGVFFDEVSNQASLASYYATAAAVVRQDIAPASGKSALVAINPGTYPALSIADTADITVMHESADMNLPPVPATLSSYSPNKFAYLSLGISNLPQTQAATLTSLFHLGIGYAYVTDQGNGTDPWAVVSTDYSSLVQSIQTLNQTLR
jgi:hypothetical protein